jgi:hypothetical protein
MCVTARRGYANPANKANSSVMAGRPQVVVLWQFDEGNRGEPYVQDV